MSGLTIVDASTYGVFDEIYPLIDMELRLRNNSEIEVMTWGNLWRFWMEQNKEGS